MSTPEDERPVDLFDDGMEILPDTTGDERGAGWGERVPDAGVDADTARLLEDRPPHWG
ncbi:hypothetical protein HNR23_000889 [Nocardiopsis mwathae]|uniref:Uncharacterized protein n=1 Tax=Nocardiopsis mwathae TaxID=1472723 RepID=A0A7W9YES2_9ACTN|nr:hypothetical protein [Nocardiopsis mwathae]MBB6170829.1 hypothetical protein [Nocardiopsis mwathae]